MLAGTDAFQSDVKDGDGNFDSVVDIVGGAAPMQSERTIAAPEPASATLTAATPITEALQLGAT